jgi:hypothetical protein
MFELPEVETLARQANATLSGRRVRAGSLGNRPHKFVWYNRSPEEFAGLTVGRLVGHARARAKFLPAVGTPPARAAPGAAAPCPARRGAAVTNGPSRPGRPRTRLAGRFDRAAGHGRPGRIARRTP